MSPLVNSTPNIFIDLGFAQKCKFGEKICGDAFKFQKSKDGSRLTAVLSDGLGSGVKANVLSTMTAAMALKFASQEHLSILHAADTMMSALPICSVRKISYATFTIVNAKLDGDVRIVEMGNPQFLFFHGKKYLPIQFEEQSSKKWHDRTLNLSQFKAGSDDRIIFFSDGINQAGIGSQDFPFGWNELDCSSFITSILEKKPDISSQELCEVILNQALKKEPHFLNMDDMTCASLNFRTTRRMLLFTGPPYNAERDHECAMYVDSFQGDTAVCGGTTADIVGRELDREIRMELNSTDFSLPPMAYIRGISLVTEGVFTLTKTASYLENYEGMTHSNPAGLLAELMLRNDVIDFLVGTRVNEAHQDPNLPQELDIRRNIVARIARVLEDKFFKKVNIKYV